MLLLAGCGGGSTARCVSHGIYCENLPRQQVLHVGWNEPIALDGHSPVLVFRVRSIEVGSKGFKVATSFTNRTKQALKLPAGTQQSPRNFGLGVFTDAVSVRIEDPGQYLVRATRFDPPLPKVLEPGQTWSGTMSGSEPPRSRRWLRVVYGVFFWRGKPPTGFGPFFAYATSHNVRAPAPVGKS